MTRSPPVGTTFAGFGHHAPDRIVSSAELEAAHGLEPGWIARRTGIVERRWAVDDEALSDIALPAAEAALTGAARHGITKADIALTLLATSTPDHLLPPTAPLLTHRLGLTGSGGIDLAGACAGFIYALSLADAFVRQNRRAVLVIAANILSRRINHTERASLVLFADAAGAVVLAPSDDPQAGLQGLALATNGALYETILIPSGGSRTPYSSDLAPEATKMRLSDGPLVFQKAVSMMAETATTALHSAGWQTGEIDHWIPHQANARIIEATRKALHLDATVTHTTVARFGNSSAASIPLTLSQAAAANKLKANDKLLLTAAGAGLTGGALAFRL